MIEVKVTQMNEVEEQMAAVIAVLVAHTADLEKQATKLRGECRNRRLSYEDLLASTNEDIEYLGTVAREYRERAESFETEKLRAEQKLSDAHARAVDALNKERHERHAEVADVINTERKHNAEIAKTRDLAMARVRELFNDVHRLGVALAESERVRESWAKYVGEQAVLLAKKDELIAHHEQVSKDANERTERAIDIAQEYSLLAGKRGDALALAGIFVGETFICNVSK